MPNTTQFVLVKPSLRKSIIITVVSVILGTILTALIFKFPMKSVFYMLLLELLPLGVLHWNLHIDMERQEESLKLAILSSGGTIVDTGNKPK